MPRRRRLPVVKSNRSQILLFSILTLVLTAATVWAGRTWVRNAETLVFAVGQANGPEARFAARLATVLKNNSSRLRLKIVPNGDNAKAIAQFDRKEANLAILRTDAKIPPRARAVAILEHDVLLLVSPAGKKIKTLAELKKKKIAVARRERKQCHADPHHSRPVGGAGGGTGPDGAAGYDARQAAHNIGLWRSDRGRPCLADRKGQELRANCAARHLRPQRHRCGKGPDAKISGPFGRNDRIRYAFGLTRHPEEDVETVGLQWLLVAQSGLSTPTVSDLARIIYENKSELALDGGFASKIEPAATDKDAFIVAHPGATEYINDESKSFIERYSDLMYVALAALGIIGSLFAALYAKVTRIAPEKASELATAVLDVGERIADAKSLDALDELQDELETILRRVVIGMRDGTISGDGMDTFKLGYEFVRDEIGMRRDHLKRHPPPQDDKVVAVKTAQSA